MTPRNEIKRVLVAGGGAFKGAYQRKILEHLCSSGPYDAMLGTSVGAINLSMAVQGKFDVLNGFWDGLDTKNPLFGIPGFLKALWWKSPLPFVDEPKGLYSIEPVRKLLRQHVNAKDFKCLYGCGIVVKDTGGHHIAFYGPDDDQGALYDHILASSVMCGIMEPIERGDEILVDGGHRHVVTPLPTTWTSIREVDVVLCQSLDDKTPPVGKRDNALNNLLWGIESALHVTALEDFEDLEELAATGVKVRVWSPGESLGGMLDASRETIQWRTELGRKDIPNHKTLR